MRAVVLCCSFKVGPEIRSALSLLFICGMMEAPTRF